MNGTKAIEHCAQLGLEEQLKNGESFNIIRICYKRTCQKNK